MEVGLSLGTNIGDRLKFLETARVKITGIDGVTETARSPVYETEPVEVTQEYADEAFLNAVLIISTHLEPDALADALHQIEDQMGRTRTADRNAPRPIDLDVLYVERLSIQNDSLTVPHPRWNERRFVIQPLADIRPDLVLPGDPRPVSEILLSLPTEPNVVLFSQEW
jgi:2-amino-4-hydroxy-6-hydroxymethyldihydropteridine diphosphokinase